MDRFFWICFAGAAGAGVAGIDHGPAARAGTHDRHPGEVGGGEGGEGAAEGPDGPAGDPEAVAGHGPADKAIGLGGVDVAGAILLPPQERGDTDRHGEEGREQGDGVGQVHSGSA